VLGFDLFVLVETSSPMTSDTILKETLNSCLILPGVSQAKQIFKQILSFDPLAIADANFARASDNLFPENRLWTGRSAVARDIFRRNVS
jgi:hypothetical protein